MLDWEKIYYFCIVNNSILQMIKINYENINRRG